MFLKLGVKDWWVHALRLDVVFEHVDSGWRALLGEKVVEKWFRVWTVFGTRVPVNVFVG